MGKIELAQRATKLAELCRRLVTDTYEPAVALVTRDLECLHFSGPTERYFHSDSVGPSPDFIALAHPGIRSKLHQAVQQAIDQDSRAVVSGLVLPTSSQKFRIDVRPTFYDGEKLYLVCLADDHPLEAQQPRNSQSFRDTAPLALDRIAPGGEAGAHNIKGPFGTLSFDGAGPSNMNPSPESETPIHVGNELKSLSGALDALNAQLHAARERQQVSSDDLQNVFQFVGMEVIFLDAWLNIRYFTPTMKSQLGLVPSDIGRPFSDLDIVISDPDLMSDVLTVLRQHIPVEREIKYADRRWFSRRILPYRTRAGVPEGVVIAFADVSELRLAEESMAEARELAQSANEMRSRSLATVSYYLREPLHSLALLQGLLEKKFEGEAAQRMAALLDQTLSTMSGMLNTLADVDQLDAGTVQVETKQFPVNELLDRLRYDFASHAKVQGVDFRVVACSLFVSSDRRLLERALRTLLINALKNTMHGKILLGCRRREAALSIEILDTGLGIPESQLEPLLDELNPFNGIPRERSRGIGLTLANHLCRVLGHRFTVRSNLGKGTLFAVEVPLLTNPARLPANPWKRGPAIAVNEGHQPTGTILVIEDDPKTYELLELLLKEEGHAVASARDEISALEMVARGSIRPDLIVADYRLLRRAHEFHVMTKLEEKLVTRIPVIVLVGDVFTDRVSDLAFQNCVPLTKPVRAAELTQVIRQVLPQLGSETELYLDEPAAGDESAADPLRRLTERQRQIMQLVLAGYPSKNIAADLGISRRTVENHRASIMKKTGAKSIPELARIALAAAPKARD